MYMGKMYKGKDLIGDKLYELIDQFIERTINHKGFHFALLDSIHPFYDGNGRTCVILFTRGYNLERPVAL